MPSLFDKIWQSHVIEPEQPHAPAVLYIDLHLIHEVTSPQAFTELSARGLKVHAPARTLATMDHSTPTLARNQHGQVPFHDEEARKQVQRLEQNCREFAIELHDFESQYRGIVHVMGPELGATLPGMTIVCGDSHTATHGAFGALAFGIGTTEVSHVLATQALLQRKPKSMVVNVHGRLRRGVSAKDLVLHIIGQLGFDGGTGFVIEYRGEAISALDMEARMTLCNMSIEAGARAGLIAPDQTTFDYLRGRPKAPQGAEFEKQCALWSQLSSDEDAHFDASIDIDADRVRRTISFGTAPDQVIAIDQAVPSNPDQRASRALSYMGWRAGQKLLGERVDVVFIGSCTNSRLSDLRVAAQVLRGHRIAAHVRLLVVPGSEAVKRAAEAEGIDQVVRAAGGEWREPGCSMCIAMNGDKLEAGQLAVSTSNRNFEGRQGQGGRTILASPEVAAHAARAGVIVDPEQLTEAA
jgi:3-isopropylmalate/(R)-2-methylmalate dehydratase large subunit